MTELTKIYRGMQNGAETIDNNFNKMNAETTAQLAETQLNFSDSFVNLATIETPGIAWGAKINELLRQGKNILIPAKTIEIEVPIIWDGKVSIQGVNRQKSIIKAKSTFDGYNLIETTFDEEGVGRRKYAQMTNFTLDANYQVSCCLYLKNGEGFNIYGINMMNATNVIFEIGHSSLSVNACNISDLMLAGDISYLKPFSEFPQYCLKVNINCTDNNFSMIFGYDAQSAIFIDSAGNNRYNNCHGWGTLLDEKLANYIFRLDSSNNELTQCFADSPRMAGYYIGGWGNKIDNSKCLIYNDSGNFTETVYVEIASGVGEAFFNLCKFFQTGTTQLTNNAKINGTFRRNQFSNMSISPTTNPVIQYYSDFAYPIFLGNNTFTFTFPVPVTDTNYSVFVDATFNTGGYYITRTVNGFTINFTNTTNQQELVFVKVNFVY